MNKDLDQTTLQKTLALYPDCDYIVFTDGASSGNPGPGGLAYLIIKSDGSYELETECHKSSTNNQMELLAALYALQKTRPGSKITLITDSQYFMKGFTEGWLTKWKNNGWKTFDGKPVKNQHLWKALDEIIQSRKVDFVWVKGHADDPLNNLVDKLARESAQKAWRLSS